jgi:filamentous hemagglutinin family protein
MRGDRLLLGLLLGLSGAIGLSIPAIAQLNLIPDTAVDRSLGTSIVPVPGLPIDLVAGGTRPQNGQNLFHSFQEFNVQAGRGVYFNNPAGVQNIFSRVTGTDRSDILGVLGVAGGTANLFLINPNGILFGPNASLDVGGSFAATTANAIQFGNDGLFSASVPTISNLLTIAPSAFLFNAIDRPASIVNQSATQGTTFLGRQTFSGLQVPNGKSLLLLGGDVQIEGGILQAPGGRVDLGGLADASSVGLTATGGELRLQFPDVVSRSNILLKNGSLIQASGAEGGAIQLQGNQVSLSDNSRILSYTSGSGTGADLLLRAANLTLIDNSAIELVATDSGQGGNIQIETNSLNILNGSQVTAATLLSGRSGNVTITSDSIILAGLSSDSSSSVLRSRAFDNASGNVGDVTVLTRLLNIRDGGAISASTSGQGRGGELKVVVREAAEFSGTDGQENVSGLFSTTSGAGDAGNLNLDAGKLRIIDGAAVTASSFGQGVGGDVTVSADSIEVVGRSADSRFASGISSQASVDTAKKAGNVDVSTRFLSVRNGAIISSSTVSQGSGGDLNVIADSIEILGFSNDRQFVSELSSRGIDGNPGNIKVSTRLLNIRDGGVISTRTFGKGRGGNITVTVHESAEMVGTDGQESVSGLIATTSGSGDAGNVILEVKDLRILDGAAVTASTFGQGAGGNVTVSADSIQVIGVSTNPICASGSQVCSSGISSQANVGSTKNSGDVNIFTRLLGVYDNGTISTLTLGQGNAGGIVLRVSDQLRLVNGSISTSSEQSAGGSINIAAKTIRLSDDGDIITSVFSGAGGGGNITLTANSIIALNDSDILAFARDGRGGNVTLNTRAFFGRNYRPAPFGTDPLTLEGNDRVDINASGSVSGIITLPDTSFIQNSLNQLPNNNIDTNKLLDQTCLIRQDQPEGTFYITGTGGIPNRPNDPALSTYPTNTIQPTTQTATKPWKLGDPIVEPQGFYKLADGQMVMSRECDR